MNLRMNLRLLSNRILMHQREQNTLREQHDNMVNEFRQRVVDNQTRFAQLSGHIAELEELKKLYEQPDGNGSGEPDSLTDRFLSPEAELPGG